MSIVIVKKCFVPPAPLTAFDTGLVPVDAAHIYGLNEAAGEILLGNPPPPPFDGCISATEEFQELPAIPADGIIEYACIGTGFAVYTLNMIYTLPLRLKPGVWSMTAAWATTTARSLPTDEDFIYKDVYGTFYHDGWPGIGYTPPPLPFAFEDGTALTTSWECDVPPLTSDLADPCTCLSPGRLYLGCIIGDQDASEPNIMPIQAGTVRFTGTWLSDFPP
jgi:hypothetical protein